MALPTNSGISEIAGERSVGRIFGASDAAARFGVSFSTLKRGWPKGIYPAPIRVSENRIGWLEADILIWQRERVAERDARTMQKSA